MRKLYVCILTLVSAIASVNHAKAQCTPTPTQNFTNNTPVAIPTGPGVVTSTINVAGAPTYLYDLNITTFITHTFAADLDITITSPAGTIITLTSDNGAGNDNVFNGTVWDDDANPGGLVPYTTNNGLVTDHVYTNLVLASPLVPEEGLGAFIGENPNGTWTITISDDLAGDGGSLDSWTLGIQGLSAAPTVTLFPFTNNTPVAIPTGPGVVTSTINVAGAGTQLIDVNVFTNLTHTFAADLDITITSPAGTIVTLTTDNGAGNDNVFAGTLWDDDANPGGLVPYTTNNGLATDHSYVNLTLANPLAPEEALAAFIGENPNGTWTITISDDLAGDGGSLDAWGLDIRTASCAAPVLTPCSGTANTYANNTPVPIADVAVSSSSITVAGAPAYLYDINILTNITHTFAADMDITITSPAGTVVTLTSDNGAGNDNVFAGTVWDDDANPGGTLPYTTNSGIATDHVYANNVLASSLAPEEPLAAFIGENPNGTWTLRVSDDLAGDVGTINSWSISIGASNILPVITTTSVANNTPLAIPTGPAVVTSTINVSGAGSQIFDVNLLTNLTHTFAADLDITITSPAGTTVTLTTDNGAGNDNVFAGTVWDNDANPAGQVPYTTNNGLATDHAYTNLVTATPLAPEESLGAFFGEDPNGTWTITISDDLSGDGGTLNSWGLDIQTFICAPPCSGVPSPGSIAPVTTTVCTGTPVVLTVSGYSIASGLAFQWKESTTPGGTYTNIPGATSTTYSFNAPASTRYYVCTVTCTNPGGGSATTAEVVVNVGNVQHSSITATPNSGICSPGTSVITATATGGIGNYTHTLAGPGTIGAPSVSGANNQNVSFTVTNIPAGTHTYTVTSTDAIGCSKASTVNLTVNQTPIISLTTVPPGPVFTNYTVTSSGGNSIVPGTTLVPGSQGDDLTVAIPLPFTYYAYGSGYTSLRASSNGNLQFSGAGNAAFTNTCPLPTTTALGFPSFMPHWDDVRTDVNAGDGIYTSVSGVAPNRIFNIEWRGSLFSVGGSTVNFEARLYEAEQRVDFIYGSNTNNGSSATVGIQGAASPTPLFTQFSCNSASLSSGLMVSFVAPSVAICNGDIVRIDATAVPASPQTFTSLVNTHVPAGGTTTGIASPYPNTLAVSGLTANGISVRSVTINSYSHTFPDDVDLVLVSPSGQSVILMSDAGGATDATGQNLTFDDAAPSTLADAAFNATGTYKPTNFGAGDNWPAPGPGGTPSSTTLSSFTGNMNGNWNLYAFDDASGDVGFIGTWSITFNIPQPVIFSPVTNLFTDAAATVAYTGTPAYTVWARPTSGTASYTASSTIAGCSNTATVNITVNQRPVINTQPTAPAAPVCPGFNTTFTVGATATNIAYQWQRSIDNGTTWVNVPEDALHTGTTTASITVVNPQIPQNGHRYRVIVSGVCPPAVTSNSVTLVVATPPTITTQPANRIVCAPDAAVFTVVAGGTPAPNIYQWQVSTNSGGTWTNLTTGGSYTPTLTVSPTATSQTGSWYRVIVTNNCGQSVTSNNATLTVNAPTPVTIAPLPSRICISDTLVNLSATPVGGSWSGIGVSGFNFVPSATAVGTYTLTYTYVNAAGCTSTGTVAAPVVDCPERIRQLDDNAVILFPNPNNGRFNIRINSVLYNYLGMNVYNTAGQLLHRQTFGGLVYGRVVPIDLNHLPAGAYMVKFFYDDGIRTNEKTFPVIIQRQ